MHSRGPGQTTKRWTDLDVAREVTSSPENLRISWKKNNETNGDNFLGSLGRKFGGEKVSNRSEYLCQISLFFLLFCIIVIVFLIEIR